MNNINESDIDSQIKLRLAWLNYTSQDGQILNSNLKPFMLKYISKYMDMLYDHFSKFSETSKFFSSKESLNRAKSAQTQYFLNMVEAPIDRTYINNLIKIGQAHQRINLEPNWYIGAYGNILGSILPDLYDELTKEEYKATISSLIKTIFFDITVVIENYLREKDEALSQKQNLINKLASEQVVLNELFNNAPLALIYLDCNLKCLNANQNFQKIFSKEGSTEIIGLELKDISHELSRIIRLENKSTNIKTLKVEHLNKTRYFNVLNWPIQDSQDMTYKYIIILEDITDTINLQIQRDDFVATLTHDLKTPVLAANKILGLLLENEFGQLPDEQAEIISKLLKSNDDLYKLVNNIVDNYRFDKYNFTFNKIDLKDLIQKSIDTLYSLANSKKIAIKNHLAKSQENLTISGDIFALERVFQNIIDNAIKYSNDESQIIIDYQINEKSIIIKITDFGLGIDDKTLNKLFEKFTRSAQGYKTGSSGLGLYLCKKIIDQHQGAISIESRVNSGTTVILELKKNID